MIGLRGCLRQSTCFHRNTLSAFSSFPLFSSSSFLLSRSFATQPAPQISLLPAEEQERLKKLRNIGISAHIDSGKTTLTERILFYTGRIDEIHEVRGRDNIGAKMDSMELEREKGITIQSAATHVQWRDHHINIIDTPGHVDFTIEVERALRVLDGAIMVLCGVAGVQSQSLTVDKQMKRYKVPRLCFINKLDRTGANPWKGLSDIQKTLKHNAQAVQIPIGLEDTFKGIVDIIERKAYVFDGPRGEKVKEIEVPEDLKETMEEKRKLLVEKIADCDETLGEIFLMEEDPTAEQLRDAIRRATLALKFIPVFMGSAYKNKGVQLLLDGVVDYLPNPTEVQNFAFDQSKKEAKVELINDIQKPLVALAFKLEERQFGQLTYMRIYQGILRKRDTMVDVVMNKKLKVTRIVRMHSNEMEEIEEAPAGDIVAMFGVDCYSGTTFTSGEVRYTMTSMYVPDPVISLAIQPKSHSDNNNFSKALARFQKEDPTFRVTFDQESQQTLIHGMGELHLEIYCERIKREYKIQTITGNPQVNFREAIAKRGYFNYTHKKQSGGAGQFGRVIGYVEPIEPKPLSGETEMPPIGYLSTNNTPALVFDNQLIGNNIPPEFHAAIEKGFKEAVAKGDLCGYPVLGVRAVVTDGASHAVDSNEISFRLAAIGGFRDGFRSAAPMLLEPIMDVEVTVPSQFQGAVVGGLNRRKGIIQHTETREDGTVVIRAQVPLESMFGYSTDLRSSTEGKGEYTMEYLRHEPAPRDKQNRVIKEYEQQRAAELAKKR